MDWWWIVVGGIVYLFIALAWFVNETENDDLRELLRLGTTTLPVKVIRSVLWPLFWITGLILRSSR